jgi:hypothetical protein
MEKANQFQLIAFDPGGTIGWARLTLHVKAFTRPDHRALRYVESWDCGEFTGTENEQIAKARDLIQDARWGPMPFTPLINVITEDFDLVQTVGGKELVSPIRINAVIEWICLTQFSLELKYQKRQARTGITPERLRAFGFEGRWVTKGAGKDSFAAMQHAIRWLRHLKQEADRRPWKLGDGVTHNARWDCACTRGKRHNLIHPS